MAYAFLVVVSCGFAAVVLQVRRVRIVDARGERRQFRGFEHDLAAERHRAAPDPTECVGA